MVKTDTSLALRRFNHTFFVSELPVDCRSYGRSGASGSIRESTTLKTRLPNRQRRHDRFRQALAQAQRQHKQVVVLLLDLDGFKGVSDRLGHAAGHHVLQQVAKRLNDCVRVADTVCRYGGDEFVLVLPEIEHDNTAGVVADKIRTHLDAPYRVDGNVTAIKASIGIAVYPNDGEDYRSLIEHADLAMYRAKGDTTPTSRVV